MSNSKVVTVVHPDSQCRVLLRSVLQSRGFTVITDHSWSDLLEDRSGVTPGVILVDRSALGEDAMDVLERVRQKWTASEIVFLPEQLETESLLQLVLHVDRLLLMRTTQELLAI